MGVKHKAVCQRLDGDGVVLVPYIDVVHVDVPARHVKAVRVEGIKIEQSVGVTFVLPIGDGAMGDFEPRYVKCGERPVGRLVKIPPLDKDVPEPVPT